jgi:hypothetical protein
MKKLLSFFALFGSVGTLFCCALPTLFVAIGMGATVAGLVSAVPQLVWLSERKAYLFGFCAVMLVFSGWMQWRARFEPCPLDPDLARACTSSRVWSLRIYIFTLVIFLTGLFFAYLGPLLFF